MQFRVFHIPLRGAEDAMEEMNRFLRGHRVLAVEKRFCEGEAGGWAFCVEYEVASGRGTEGRPGPKVDYKEVLNEAQFALFSRLRALRKHADGGRVRFRGRDDAAAARGARVKNAA